MNQLEILNQLKSVFPNANYKDDYRLKSIEANLFFPPYGGIDERAYSICSSAAMIYNTIGPDSIIIDGKKYSNIIYEREFPALDNKDNSDHDHSAHLDVSMIREDGPELLLIEAKMLEWIDIGKNNPKSCNKAYLSSYCYRKESKDMYPHFKESFLSLINPDSMFKTEKLYPPSYKRYDAIQMNIHILGIYNYCARKEEKIPKKIRLLNVVWDYDEAEEYQTEEREGKEYVAYANVTFRNLFKQLGVDFSVEYIRYSEFLNRVDWTNKLEHRKYLRRYEIKYSKADSYFSDNFDTLWNETKHKDESQKKYEDRIIGDKTVHLEDDAFDKGKSKARYNPKGNETYSRQKLETKEDEEWKFLTNQYYTKYAVSNIGRVAFLDSDGLYHVLEQDDKDSKGYLRLDPLGKFSVDHQIEVYKLIAMGFLGKQIGDGYDVHHRINDGYNCRKENLILLTREQHNKVHRAKK